jgi:thiosulfate dehydrogenase
MKIILLVLALSITTLAHSKISISELEKRVYLDDYYSNVLLGYNIINATKKNAYRYTGNDLNCTSCHQNQGTKKFSFPLNVAGMYPKWRDKNGKRNGIGLRIRECFVYSLDGIMPPESSPEVMALSAYISYLSEDELIGRSPKGRGTIILEDTGFSPNPANGKEVYRKNCQNCHLDNGSGTNIIPALWGLKSYNEGSGMHNTDKLSGWIWNNMPLGNEKSLKTQEAKDVAAYINTQIRPSDPRDSKILKILESIIKKAQQIIN